MSGSLSTPTSLSSFSLLERPNRVTRPPQNTNNLVEPQTDHEMADIMPENLPFGQPTPIDISRHPGFDSTQPSRRSDSPYSTGSCRRRDREYRHRSRSTCSPRRRSRSPGEIRSERGRSQDSRSQDSRSQDSHRLHRVREGFPMAGSDFYRPPRSHLRSGDYYRPSGRIRSSDYYRPSRRQSWKEQVEELSRSLVLAAQGVPEGPKGERRVQVQPGSALRGFRRFFDDGPKSLYSSGMILDYDDPPATNSGLSIASSVSKPVNDLPSAIQALSLKEASAVEVSKPAQRRTTLSQLQSWISSQPTPQPVCAPQMPLGYPEKKLFDHPKSGM